ncbi:MAG: DUF3108 domain-containing protein, partial [Planctomycetota bacterium]|nr:DUF3108 domain-containing protein [Planctomycetota bacterium]
MRNLALGLVLLPFLSTAAQPGPVPTGAPQDEEANDEGMFVDRGEAMGFTIPQDEELDFKVIVDLAVVGETGVGSFRLSAGTEMHRAGLAAPEPGKKSGKKVGWIRGQAVGSALNYTLDHTVEARVMPQEWPHVIYRDTQAGSEHRKRELMYGWRQGKPTSWYRSDGHCRGCERPEHIIQGTWPFSSDHHCPSCRRGVHRLWGKPTVQDVPEGSVDMLTAIHLSRAMIQNGLDSIEFPLLDKEAYWDVTMSRGESRNIKTPAGTFRCIEVKLDPKLPPEKKEGRFRGLFGIHGTLSIWLHEGTGIPVEIGGVIPAGIFDV